jgi:hypothetical protein
MRRVGKGALRRAYRFVRRKDDDGHAKFIIGRAFARPVALCPPNSLARTPE